MICWMDRTTFIQRRRLEALEAPRLIEHQLGRLNALLRAILPQNKLYTEKLAAHVDMDRVARADGPLDSLDQLGSLPFTFKEELQAPVGSGQLAANLTFPLQDYVRLHQTSGTRGRPLAVLDTADDWQWWIECWQYVLDGADIQPQDCCLMAFSFGPFIGFWSRLL